MNAEVDEVQTELRLEREAVTNLQSQVERLQSTSESQCLYPFSISLL